MLVCWEWLAEYVDLNIEPGEMALRFAMSGLNHESTVQVGSDTVVDLEVTSNRGDCLGHIGVAREAAVLLGQPLRTPLPTLAESSVEARGQIAVENQFPGGCPEYAARVIRGIKIGPSPDWLVRRLNAIGINSINNVVDVTNYVMMECGQPLHAFDLQQIRGGKIIVRPAQEKEKFIAIDHKTYELDSQMVVIADAERAVAIGGIMGGAESEVSDQTTDLLIEAARFSPMAIRRAARKLKLHSPSSYRFERGPDPMGLQWACDRCCELILKLAGGQLAIGTVRAGMSPPTKDQITFRLGQIRRVIGIDVPRETVLAILTSLGCELTDKGDEILVSAPSWRGDLHREVDLIEEVARIYGYDKIPENVAVPIGVAAPRPRDIALQRARLALSAFGIDEAMTPSVVCAHLEEFGSVWSSIEPLTTDTPLLVGSKLLRRSLVPSLLASRQANQAQAVRNAQLYEVANIYLPGVAPTDLPTEQYSLGIVTDGDLQFAKGLAEEIIAQIAGTERSIAWDGTDHGFFQKPTGQMITCGKQLVGFVGLVSKHMQQKLDLDQATAFVELNIDALTALLEPVRAAKAVSAFPAVSRDLNFVVDEPLTWAAISSTCQANGGEHLQRVEYKETYRDANKDGTAKKRTLLTLHFQSLARTLTGEEVDAAVQNIIIACGKEFGATLLG